MATTILCSIGSRSADNVTVSSVSGSDPGPYTVTLNAAVPATTKVGDTLIDSGARTYLIEGISGSDLTVYKRHFGAGADPATGAGTTQRAYSKIHSWSAAAPASLVTADQVWKGECWNDATIEMASATELATFAAASDGTRYYHLTTAAGQSYIDHANKATNVLRPNQSYGVLVEVTGTTGGPIFTSGTANNDYYGIIEKIQILDSRSSGDGNIAYFDWGADSTLGMHYKNLLGKLRGISNTSSGTFYIRAGVMVNCAFSFSVNGACAISSGSGRSIHVSGCTFLNTGTSSEAAIQIFGSSLTAKGVVTLLWGANNSSLNASSSNNATDRATFATGSSSDQTSLTASSQLEGIAAGGEDLRAKSAGSLNGNGVRDQTYTNDLDIVGQSRSTTTPTIGAWEVVAGGASAVQSLMQISG